MLILRLNCLRHIKLRVKYYRLLTNHYQQIQYIKFSRLTCHVTFQNIVNSVYMYFTMLYFLSKTPDTLKRHLN